MRGVKQVRLKAADGRGRERVLWVEALHLDLRPEFDSLRKVGENFHLALFVCFFKSVEFF